MKTFLFTFGRAENHQAKIALNDCDAATCLAGDEPSWVKIGNAYGEKPVVAK